MVFIPIVEVGLPFERWMESVTSHTVESPMTF